MFPPATVECVLARTRQTLRRSSALARRASKGRRWVPSLALRASVIVVLLAGCSRTTDQRPRTDRLPVFAGIPPVAYLVEQIGGDRVSLDVLVQPGQDPHTFEPTPQQALALSQAKLFFKIGMPFENALVGRLPQGNQRLKVVDISKDVQKLDNSGHCHDHEDQCDHADPHVWLSPPLLKIEANNVATALCDADPSHAAEYRHNLTALLGRIDATHRRIERLLSPYRGRSFLVFHPGFAYFANAFGLKEEAVQFGGHQPAPKQLHELIDKANAEGIKTIFVQPEFDPRSAAVIAEQIGGHVVTMKGLAKDVLADMEDIAAKLAKSFAAETPRRHGEHGNGKTQEGLTPPSRKDAEVRVKELSVHCRSLFPSLGVLAPLREPSSPLRDLRVSVVQSSLGEPIRVG